MFRFLDPVHHAALLIIIILRAPYNGIITLTTPCLSLSLSPLSLSLFLYDLSLYISLSPSGPSGCSGNQNFALALRQPV